MCTVAEAVVERVTVGDRSAGAIECVADKICAILYQAAGAKTASKSGMGIIDASVHYSDAEALASETFCAELVDLGQDMRRPRVGRVGLALVLGGGIILACPGDVQVWHGDQWDRPQLLDLGKCGYLAGSLVVGTMDLEGYAFEDLGLETETTGDPRNACFGLDLAEKAVGILCRG